MADLPENPNNREEEYLADLAGENGTKPANPWSRKEAYLDAIDGRMDDVETQIAALASDLSFKGSVADEAHLPSGAATGDTYITEDTGVMYVWTGTDWVALGGTGINVLQSPGASTTDVMSQKATTDMVFQNYASNDAIRINKNAYSYSSPMPAGCISIGADGNFNARNCVLIGKSADASSDDVVAIGRSSSGNSGGVSVGLNSKTHNSGVAIGSGAVARKNTYPYGPYAVAIGGSATATESGAVAIGAFSSASTTGEMNIGSSNVNYGYGNTNYRLLSGVHDPVGDHDAATKGYVDANAGGTIFYLADNPFNDPDNICLYKDAGFTQAITGAEFCQAARSGSPVVLAYFEENMEHPGLGKYYYAHLVDLTIPNEDTIDAYDYSGGPTAYGSYGMIYFTLNFLSADPSATQAFSISGFN